MSGRPRPLPTGPAPPAHSAIGPGRVALHPPGPEAGAESVERRCGTIGEAVQPAGPHPSPADSDRGGTRRSVMRVRDRAGPDREVRMRLAPLCRAGADRRDPAGSAPGSRQTGGVGFTGVVIASVARRGPGIDSSGCGISVWCTETMRRGAGTLMPSER